MPHCEKKAAGAALNLIFAYGGLGADFCRELSGIVAEELTHFRQVLDLLDAPRDSLLVAKAERLWSQAERPGAQRGAPARHRPPAGGRADRSTELRAIRAICASTSPTTSWPTSTAACSSRKRATTAPTCSWPAVSAANRKFGAARGAGRGRSRHHSRRRRAAAHAQLNAALRRPFRGLFISSRRAASCRTTSGARSCRRPSC